MRPMLFLATLLAFFYAFSGCNNGKTAKVVKFSLLADSDFNFAADSSYAVRRGKMWDERKRLHDSCMGVEFPANAMFIRKKDTFQLGTIVNKKTMKMVKMWDMRGIDQAKFWQLFSLVTKPCYERMPMRTSVDSFFNKKIVLSLPGVPASVNAELNDAVQHTHHAFVAMGSWYNVELTDALGKILDTTKNEALLAYKSELVDPDNIVLIRSSSITDITFYLHTGKQFSSQLLAVLKRKPTAAIENAKFFSAQLFYLDDTSLEVSFSGNFQVMGQFMKCSLQ